MIGVLDLQGGVEEHLDHLRRIGIHGRRVKHASDLSGIAGLIIPGGESTCLSRLIRLFGLRDAVIGEFRRGLKIWGTCAGAILLARSIVGESPHLALIDMEIERNGFGSQLDSFAGEALVSRVAPHPIPLTFIRAPKITRVGHGVDVLLEMNGYIAAAESPGVLATVFHPELTGSLAFHRYFANKCGLSPASGIPDFDPTWSRVSSFARA